MAIGTTFFRKNHNGTMLAKTAHLLCMGEVLGI